MSESPNPFPDTPPIPEELQGGAQRAAPERSEKKDSEGSSMARAFAIGMNFAYAVAGMVLFGWALQTWVFPKAAPWLLLGGLFVGLVGGMYLFVREAIRESNKP